MKGIGISVYFFVYWFFLHFFILIFVGATLAVALGPFWAGVNPAPTVVSFLGGGKPCPYESYIG
jgi:hypothetical protein